MTLVEQITQKRNELKMLDKQTTLEIKDTTLKCNGHGITLTNRTNSAIELSYDDVKILKTHLEKIGILDESIIKKNENKNIYIKAIKMAEEYIKDMIKEGDEEQNIEDKDYIMDCALNYTFLLNKIKKFVADEESIKKDN